MRYFSGLVLLFLACTVFSQANKQADLSPGDANYSPTIDARLFEAFDSAYLFTIQETNPTLILRWNFYLDHAFVVTDFPTEKGNIEEFEEIELPSDGAVNIFSLEKKYKMHHAWDTMKFYKIKGTHKVLAYFPGQEFMRKFNKAIAEMASGRG